MPKHWARRVLSLAVAAMGLINIGSALFSHTAERISALRHLVPTDVLSASRTYTLLAGVLLCVTAWGLWRGKRRALLLALFLCAASVPVNVLKAGDVEEATVAAVLLFALGASADAFRVQSAELTAGRFWRLTGWTALAFVTYALGGSYWLLTHSGEPASLVAAAAESMHRVLGLGTPILQVDLWPSPAISRIARWYLESLPFMGITLVGGLAVLAFRPVAYAVRHREQLERVKHLVATHGDSSISAFATAPENDYFFSANGRSVLAYQAVAGTLLVIGDAIGPEEERVSLLQAFAEFCAQHEWRFGFFQARPEHLASYRQLGWSALHIGEDPVIEVERFTLEGSAMGDVRRASRKLGELGMEVRHFRPAETPFEPAVDPDGMHAQMAEISAEWLRAHAGGEKAFCMSRFETRVLRESWLAVAWNPGTRVVEGFVTWVPIPARRGWALDLMRRRKTAPAGIMELLVAASVENARAHGDALLSLSLSPLVRAEGDGSEKGETAAVPDERREPDAAEVAAAGQDDMPRVREFLIRHLKSFYDFEGLFRWKKKFDPAFEARYLVYPSASALPAVALALARAQSPGGLRGYIGDALTQLRAPRTPPRPRPPGGTPPR